MKLGDKLKEARTNANLKQDELAERIGVSRQTISNWENNRSFPDIGSLLKLSDLYSISLDEMLKQDRGVVQQLEDLAEKHRNFWQMMLEIAIILELLGNFLYTQEFIAVGTIIGYAGIALLYLSLIMHLRVFDHSQEELLCGWLALGLQCVFVRWYFGSRIWQMTSGFSLSEWCLPCCFLAQVYGQSIGKVPVSG